MTLERRKQYNLSRKINQNNDPNSIKVQTQIRRMCLKNSDDIQKKSTSVPSADRWLQWLGMALDVLKRVNGLE